MVNTIYAVGEWLKNEDKRLRPPIDSIFLRRFLGGIRILQVQNTPDRPSLVLFTAIIKREASSDHWHPLNLWDREKTEEPEE